MADVLNDLAVPIILLILGWLGKGLVKQKVEPEIFFMGPDLILAGMGSSIAHAISYGRLFFTGTAVPQSNGTLISAGRGLGLMFIYMLAAMGVYLAVLAIHKGFEPAAGATTTFKSKRFFFLGWVCNFVGFCALAAVLFLVRSGVS